MATAPAPPAFASTSVARLNALLADPRQVRSPLPQQGPPFRFPPTGLSLLGRVRRRPGESAWVRRAQLMLEALFAYIVLSTGLPVGGFDDGLRMTIDCGAAQADRIEALLRDARAQGIARFGLHREAAALMTCIAPLPSHSDHVHFIDGATAGYTLSTAQLKADG